jgi:hypothetical protein
MYSPQSSQVPYEPCGLCGRLGPSAQMQPLYVTVSGQRQIVKVCPQCRSPNLAYIQGGNISPPHIDPADVLLIALGIILVMMGALLGVIAGDDVGVAILVTCALLGAGTLAGVAARKC